MMPSNHKVYRVINMFFLLLCFHISKKTIILGSYMESEESIL